MQLTDEQRLARADLIRKTFANPDSPIMKALSDRFLVRTFRFSSSTARLSRAGRPDLRRHADAAGQRDRERAAGAGRAAGLGPRPRHRRRRHDRRDRRRRAARVEGGSAAGLHRRRRPGNAGARHPGRPRLDAAHRAQGHVAAGRRRADPDRLRRADGHARRRGRRTHRRVAAGAPAGRRRSGVGARALHREPRPARASSASRSPPQPGEVVTQNNQRDVQIDVRDRQERILYYEGEPRFEMKFARQAIKDDQNLELVTLQRTAENKYLPPRHRRRRRRARGRLSEDARGAVRVPRPRARQRRGERVHRRSAAHDLGVRRRARRRAARARRRRARSRKGGYAGTPLAEALPVVIEQVRRRLHAPQGAPDARRRGARRHAARRHRGGVGGALEDDAAAVARST